MRTLIKLRLNANTQNYKNLQILISNKRYNSIHNVSVSNDINKCQRLLTSTQCNVARTDYHYPHYKFENVHYFSTTNILLKSKDRGKDKKKTKTTQINFNELTEVLDSDRLLSQYEQAVENLKNQFIKHLAVRSNVGSIEDIHVKFEGADYTLQELVQISRKPKMVVLNVSEFPQTIPNILESLRASQMNLNPQQEGTTLYIPIPKVTKEHRENLAKTAKSFFTKCQENIRDVRNKHIKDLKKDTKVDSELAFRVEGYIDTLSHQYVSKAQELLDTKQKELLREAD